MHFYNDGSDGSIWEPLYRLQTTLTPCEKEVLENRALRRLQRIAHYGAAARVLPMTHTRYTHTLGVFTLTAHLCPTDFPLRLAALVHDVGHLPFSHSAERALGLDHHALTIQVLQQSGLNERLKSHGFDPAFVAGLAEGRPPNPLVCKGDGLSLDHLDSWLRDSEAIGVGEIPPHLLLARLRLNGPYVEASDAEAALEITERVAIDHTLFVQPRALALDALVTQIFMEARPAVADLLAMGDEEALTRCATKAPDLVAVLRDRPWLAVARPDDGGVGTLVAVEKLYTGQVLLCGQPVAKVLPKAQAVYQSLEALKRRYRVTWAPLP